MTATEFLRKELPHIYNSDSNSFTEVIQAMEEYTEHLESQTKFKNNGALGDVRLSKCCQSPIDFTKEEEYCINCLATVKKLKDYSA